MARHFVNKGRGDFYHLIQLITSTLASERSSDYVFIAYHIFFAPDALDTAEMSQRHVQMNGPINSFLGKKLCVFDGQ